MSEIVALPIVRRGALAVAGIVALALLLIFHSVVVGAVQRAAQRRSEIMTAAVSLHAFPATHASHHADFPAGKVSLARAGD